MLPIELHDTLLTICQEHSYRERKDFRAALQNQRVANAEKKRLIEDKQLQNAKRTILMIGICFSNSSLVGVTVLLRKQRKNTNN